MDEDPVGRRRLMAEAAEARFAKLSRQSPPTEEMPQAPLAPATAPTPAVESAAPAGVEASANGDADASAGPAPGGVVQDRMDADTAGQLFEMVFGPGATAPLMAQWSRQGFRFQTDPPSAVLVQVRARCFPVQTLSGAPLAAGGNPTGGGVPG
jgi:hypothetical protein